MWDFDKGLKLCTCEVSPELELTQDDYLWEVRTLDRTEWAQGRCRIPSQDIGNGLEHEWVELNLNCESCFDFDYQPNEGDNLVIFTYLMLDSHLEGQRLRSHFLSFMYKNNVWVEGFYDDISEISKLKYKGKVKRV